jgi:hypothetical protein
MCHDGPNCNRSICFFAHSPSQLRTPTYVKPAKGSAKQDAKHAANLQQPKAKPGKGSKAMISNRSLLNLAGLMAGTTPAAGKQAAGALAGSSMDPFAVSSLPSISPLGCADFAQLMQQDLNLQKHLGLEDLHLRLQEQLQLEDLQTRLACLHASQLGSGSAAPGGALAGAGLPSINFFCGDVSSMLSGLAWQAPCPSGSIGGSYTAPLPSLNSDPLMAAAAAACVPGGLASTFSEAPTPDPLGRSSSSSATALSKLAPSSSSMTTFLDGYAMNFANGPPTVVPSMQGAAGTAGVAGLLGNPLAASAVAGLAAVSGGALSLAGAQLSHLQAKQHQDLVGDFNGLATQALVSKMMSLV